MSKCCCLENAPDATCCSSDEKNVTVASTSLSFKDILGAWKVRWGIGRMTYTVPPGLYVVGNPDDNSPVLVSANYKLTFDILRKNLTNMDCWLLILDTKGVNVWCAAGKGTFGTDEVVHRVKEVGLSEIITHKKLILPQLSASGVSAHEIARLTGFSVVFGPVRASDIKPFITAGNQATREMRTMKFTLWDRLVLTPVELVEACKKSLLILGILFLINLFATQSFGLSDVVAYAGAVAIGTVITPVLLPFIPSKPFSLKGWILGFFWTVSAIWLFGWFAAGHRILSAGYLLLLPSISAYLAMNFTGSSTFTSPSGVLKEMKIALPLIIGMSFVGAVMILFSKIF